MLVLIMMDVMLLIALRCCSAWCCVSFSYFVILVLLVLVVGKHQCSSFHCLLSFWFLPSVLLDAVAVALAVCAH